VEVKIFKVVRLEDSKDRCEAKQIVRWNAGRSCSFDAIAELDGKKLCKRHANQHIANLVLDGHAVLAKIKR